MMFLRMFRRNIKSVDACERLNIVNEYMYNVAPELMYEADQRQIHRNLNARRAPQDPRMRRFVAVFTLTVTLLIAGLALAYAPALIIV